MFYEGSLQSGIAQAIQQQKLVACFVRDDGATSKQWEDEWLKSGWISNLLAQKAVLLRLENGSTEAGFLAAFCKIESAPTLVVIHNGKLQLQLGSEVGQEDFVNSVRKILGAEAIPGSAPTSTSQAITAQAEDDLYGGSESTTNTTHTRIPSRSPAPAAAPVAASAPTPATTASNDKGKQRAEAPSRAGIATSSAGTTSAQQAARDAQRKKKREDAEELARIKARIDQDKAERKAQAEARKAEREQERTADNQKQTQYPKTSTSGSQAQSVKLNVRLFDGRTIRSTFPRTATLEKEVRKWIDEEFAKLDSDDPNIKNRALPPYFFKHILAPQPSRELSAGDENQTLGDIDLAPSATLILIPIKGFTEAYSAGGDGVVGAATGLVGSAFGLLSSTVGYVGSALGSVLGTGAAAPQASQGQSLAGGSGSNERTESARNEREDTASIRVRTLADQRAREPRNQQFYNGNQSNVEPRPDDRG